MAKDEKSIISGSAPDNLIEDILTNADKRGASDVHIEGTVEGVKIRFRVDGILQDYGLRPLSELDTIISRLKVACQLNITEHIHPQDGHFSWRKTGSTRALDIRVSFFPSIYGEAAVMRLLNREETLVALGKLGINEASFKNFENLINQPYGMILVSGPVGSGKTTTLYSILNALDTSSKNIITLEDPVEYFMEGIRQSQIYPGRGFTFAEGLRSVLRQDPDVIMVGEIRDAETAETAIRASITGVLLLSTLHAKNSVGTVARLVDMQIEPSLIAYSLVGVVAQRLARQICPYCKVEDNPPIEIIEALGASPNQYKFYKGKGCKACGGAGYKGRLGIHEILLIDDDIRRLIVKKAPYEEMFEQVLAKGIITLKHDALVKASQGLISIDEIARVVS
jgi:type II secretory ATPase GspE/PulE/Tfp pilus assembly ATPase PilB-like protein